MFVDSFEEIFTLSGSRQAEVVEWFTQIADLVENRPPVFLQQQFRSDRQQAREFDTTATPVRIVLTLRADYLSHLERWKSVMPSLMRNRMALHLLSGPEALEAAVCPGRRGEAAIVSQKVGMQIVLKVARRPDNMPMDEIEAVPPFLSLLCEQLNAARLKSSPPNAEISSRLVTTLGDDILSNYYEESFANQPVALRHFVEDQLVSPSGHCNTLPLEDAENELKSAGVQNARQLIYTLISRRLLTAEERNGTNRLELTHDLLTPLAVRSRTTRREQEVLDKARQQIRRQIKGASTLTLLMLLFAALAAYSWISNQRAEKAKYEALQTLSRSDVIQDSEYLEQERLSEGMAYLSRAIRTNSTNLSVVARLYSALVYTINPIPLSQPMQHMSLVRSAQFSPNGRFVVTASMDNTARVWEILSKGGEGMALALAHFGEAVGQMRINNMGGEEKLSADEFRQLRDCAKTNTTSPEARHLTDWLLTPRDKRTSTLFRQ